MELMTGIEPVTSSLPRMCSTAELHEQFRHQHNRNQIASKKNVSESGKWREFDSRRAKSGAEINKAA